MKKLTEQTIRDLYRQIRGETKPKSWHIDEANYQDFIRNVAHDVSVGGPVAADNLIGEMILGKRKPPVPGTVGRAWNAFPLSKRQAAARYRTCIIPLLKKVDKGEALSCSEFVRFRADMTKRSVPSALANRVASLSFPHQLVNTVTDNSLNVVYDVLLESHQIIAVVSTNSAEQWFRRNTSITARLRELIPNTDDAWLSCLSWRIYELFC